jgi:hypothetical protein
MNGKFSPSFILPRAARGRKEVGVRSPFDELRAGSELCRRVNGLFFQ